jgi:lysosomal alpha-mannosidase
MIHHTHDDVGWLWSVDGYYNGRDGAPSVRKILTTTINELIKDPSKKFSYVEMKFFTMWWNE